MKHCNKCNTDKEYIDFHKDGNKKDGCSSKCKICASKYGKQYRENNKEYYKNYQKEYIKDVKYKDYYKEYLKNYYQNVDKQKRKDKKLVNPLYKLKLTLHSRTAIAFKRKSWRKNGTTENILGGSCEFVKNYIEIKFTEGMSWENHGEWHIDHIIPLSSAKTECELYLLCKYDNLQPLWAIDNLKKGCKIEKR